MSVPVAIKRLPHAAGIALPRYETSGAAGADLRAAIDTNLTLAPSERALIPTGLAFSIPDGFEMQIRPRSGLAAKHGVTVLNTPGTIDSDYRGEVKVILVNHGTEPFTIQRGDRIAQLVVAPVTQGAFFEADDLEATTRGEGGFGSTGIRD